MNKSTPPIFVADRGDLNVFGSVRDALAYVEPWDLSESLQVFDACGGRLRFVADGVHRSKRSVGGGTTRLDEHDSSEPEPAALAAVLRHYIASVGPGRFGWSHERLHLASLADLVSAVSDHYGVG